MSAWPMRPAPMSPTCVIAGSAPRGFSLDAGPGLRGEDNALLRVHVNEDGAADRRAERRVLARQQRSPAHLDPEVDRLADEHLLLDRPFPDVLSGDGLLAQLDVLGTNRDRDAFIGPQLARRPDDDLAEVRLCDMSIRRLRTAD